MNESKNKYSGPLKHRIKFSQNCMRKKNKKISILVSKWFDTVLITTWNSSSVVSQLDEPSIS